ncbi:MAG: thiol-disulfide oxidoreductase DCC family protein [Alphaproteobacteria bacterium]|nr:thiol-disulfide oxidoreductase DCC family protein [Alphaproteobacteria bacterium]MBV8412827.1 thiol-disulfide oxidoreductase DCC family protein [Alphaproteobacteria bacterium]
MRRAPYSWRTDAAVPAFPDDRPILIFDGHCVMCSGFARFILRNDRERRFRLMAAQSPVGAALYRHFGLDPRDYETNILIEDGQAWFKSEGSIRIFERLGWPWSAMSLGRVLPRPLRDGLYEIIARNRLRWFGRRETCYLPEPADADRFIA